MYYEDLYNNTIKHTLTVPSTQVTITYPKPEIRKELVDKCIFKFKPILEMLHNGWIAGGAVRDFFANEDTNGDIDVFFLDQKSLELTINGLNHDIGLQPKYNNDSVAAYHWYDKTLQLIKTHFFASPQETIGHFDFTVACAAVDLKGVYVHDMFFQDLAGKRLAINKLPFPLATLERLQKYIKKGYTACNGTLLEIAKAIQNVNLTDNNNSLEFYPDGTPRFVRFD